MENNQNYKNRALASLEGKWTKGVVATLIYLAIYGLGSELLTRAFSPAMGAAVSSLWTLLCIPLAWSFTAYFLNLIRDEDINYERLFDGYKDFARVFLAVFLIGLAVAVGFILFIVPGIIVALMLSQTYFILKDDPEISASDALKLSKDMMDGHKMDYFLLGLSFIGWALLSLLTLGIGFLFLEPYWQATAAHFYEDLKAEYNTGL